jgi:hypothetical protein
MGGRVPFHSPEPLPSSDQPRLIFLSCGNRLMSSRPPRECPKISPRSVFPASVGRFRLRRTLIRERSLGPVGLRESPHAATTRSSVSRPPRASDPDE